jgi:hypothetical protein
MLGGIDTVWWGEATAESRRFALARRVRLASIRAVARQAFTQPEAEKSNTT